MRRFDCQCATALWSGNITTGGGTTPPRATKTAPYSSSTRRLNASLGSGQRKPFGRLLKNGDSVMHPGSWSGIEFSKALACLPLEIVTPSFVVGSGPVKSKQITAPRHTLLPAAKVLCQHFGLSALVIASGAQLYPRGSTF